MWTNIFAEHEQPSLTIVPEILRSIYIQKTFWGFGRRQGQKQEDLLPYVIVCA